MRALVRASLYYANVLASGRRGLCLILCLFTLSGVFLGFARFHEPYAMRVIEAELYALGYYRESLFFLRFAVVVLVVFSSVQLFVLETGELAVWARVSRGKALASKVFTVYGVALLFAWIALLIMEAVYRFTPYAQAYQANSLFLPMSVFTLYYAALAALLGLVSKNVFAYLVVLLGFFLSDVVVDYAVRLDEVGAFAYKFNALFPNLHQFADGRIKFLPSYPLVFVLIACLLVVSYFRQKRVDYT